MEYSRTRERVLFGNKPDDTGTSDQFIEDLSLKLDKQDESVFYEFLNDLEDGSWFSSKRKLTEQEVTRERNRLRSDSFFSYDHMTTVSFDSGRRVSKRLSIEEMFTEPKSQVTCSYRDSDRYDFDEYMEYPKKIKQSFCQDPINTYTDSLTNKNKNKEKIDFCIDHRKTVKITFKPK